MQMYFKGTQDPEKTYMYMGVHELGVEVSLTFILYLSSDYVNDSDPPTTSKIASNTKCIRGVTESHMS